MAASKLQALWNHPAGPKTIHFWAPTFKWGISIANVADFSKPPEKLSYPQQIAVTATGIIWSRYSTVINPSKPCLKFRVQFALTADVMLVHRPFWLCSCVSMFAWIVNIAMAATGIYQLSRKIQHDYSSEVEASVSKE
ncbi:hypothetical protein TIFTF001_006021 [Ficus carica]|uniref:Mitochondrial pyruvate carrier n=1 Tax=Ficus carica TaxID=3494 RepID=A0AA88CZA7_FICCA|nr:hypothetical protein TIFTF001_006021 [Ficus carica]